MNKLRMAQVFTLLLLSATFGLLCQTTALTMEGLFGAVLAALAQILICLPMCVLYARGFSFTAYTSHHKLLPFCFAGYLLIRGRRIVCATSGDNVRAVIAFSRRILGSSIDCIGLCLYGIIGDTCTCPEQYVDLWHLLVYVGGDVDRCSAAGRAAESLDVTR